MTYELMGYEVEPQEENAAGVSASEQTQVRTESVVYTTDDLDEAKKILAEGGFGKENGVYVVVNEIKFSDAERLTGLEGGLDTDDLATPSKSALGAGEPVPDNSSAEIIDGRVRSDKTKRPVEPTDIEAMLEADAQAAEKVPNKRTIIDG